MQLNKIIDATSIKTNYSILSLLAQIERSQLIFQQVENWKQIPKYLNTALFFLHAIDVLLTMAINTIVNKRTTFVLEVLILASGGGRKQQYICG